MARSFHAAALQARALIAICRFGGLNGHMNSPIPPLSRPKGRKIEQVIKGAQAIFARDGFEGASVDDIAREAGVSKATLYSYFPDKRLLFVGVWMAECDRFTDQVVLPQGASIAEFLTLSGRQIAEFMLSQEGRDLFRLVVAEVARFPELAQAFHANGLGRMRDRLADQLRLRAAAGELKIENFELAAEQFVQLSRAGFSDRLMLNLVGEIAAEDIEASVSSAVGMFLARYGL